MGTAAKRREEILRLLRENGGEVLTAGELAERFHVSRQIIVGDIAILRAGGAEVLATARGYRLLDGQAAPAAAKTAVPSAAARSLPRWKSLPEPPMGSVRHP